MKVEIFERKSGKVIDTKEVDNIDSFDFYFFAQCDSIHFDYRVKA